MIKQIAICILILSVFNVYSQDLIIINKGDSINCKISKINNDQIFFSYLHNKKLKDTSLFISQINRYDYNFFNKKENVIKNTGNNGDNDNIRIGVNIGLSYRFANIPEGTSIDLSNFLNRLRTGYNFGVFMEYYFSSYFGFGGKFNSFIAFNKGTINNKMITYADFSDETMINYFAPTLNVRLKGQNKKNTFIFNTGIGYLSYSDRLSNISGVNIEGNTLGWNLGVSYDRSLSKDISLGFKFSILYGCLKKADIDNGIIKTTIDIDRDSFYRNMTRADFSIIFIYK
ncbi:MAG: hypothetical protein Q8880_04500 [Bacteroidota bacterium]|nr:hypothetical protein [Bacteroidota bacterium]